LFSSALGYAATLDVMQGADPPTALFTGQNLITIGAIRALRSLGLQREVALVGFDDITLGDLVDPGITVVAQDPHAMGRHAGELLFAREAEPRRVVVPTQLIERGSGEIPALR
jgi:LacI family transcriptional regulator